MRDIILLEENLINQIAAGEVIERPSSVIKELVENSIDAKADEISIAIKNGGKTYISVSDNGNGIKSEDLPFAIKRFATSKLKSNNLFDINSFGFRGEALAAISSVSNFEIRTKHENDLCGFSLKNQQNENCEIIPIKQKEGTTTIVKNLFCNIPARLKFLKSDNMESLYALEIIKTIAIAHPKISFRLESNNKNIFEILKENYEKNEFTDDFLYKKKFDEHIEKNDEILIKRAKKILGESFTKNAVTLRSTNDENFEAKIRGLISIPTFSIKNHQYIFVNKRPVKDRMLNAVIRSAYSTVMHDTKAPNFILFFDVDQFDVDVNVHPTKSEVRFRNPQKIKGILINKINDELSKLKITSSTIFDSFTKITKKENQNLETNEVDDYKNSYLKYENNSNKVKNNYDGIIESREEKDFNSEFSNYSSNYNSNYNSKNEDISIKNTKSFLFPITKNMINNFSQKKFEEENLEYYKKIQEKNLNEINNENNNETNNEENFLKKEQNYTEDKIKNFNHVMNFEKKLNDFSSKKLTDEENKNYNFLGTPKTQIFDSFIISETDKEIFLIDQHAAHERIIYEEIKLKIFFDSFGNLIANVPKQKLIFHETYSINESEKLVAIEYINNINSMGFLIEISEKNFENKNFENKLIVKEVPLIMRDSNIKNLIFEILSEFKHYETSDFFLKKIHMIFATHACHTSIRANHKLTLIEIDAILRKIETTKNSAQCNHGRPSFIKISKSAIEKLFERG